MTSFDGVTKMEEGFRRGWRWRVGTGAGEVRSARGANERNEWKERTTSSRRTAAESAACTGTAGTTRRSCRRRLCNPISSILSLSLSPPHSLYAHSILPLLLQKSLSIFITQEHRTMLWRTRKPIEKGEGRSAKTLKIEFWNVFRERKKRVSKRRLEKYYLWANFEDDKRIFKTEKKTWASPLQRCYFFHFVFKKMYYFGRTETAKIVVNNYRLTLILNFFLYLSIRWDIVLCQQKHQWFLFGWWRLLFFCYCFGFEN